ncbi:DUF2500 domain-containing protein [Robertmurraya andreesenii]|uniref:Cytoskeletal protein RodZ n=1 Tax=Anoxybacillus andreesenii TaxID=1325932 RepID=A0ABT9V983_9BACL|nr:DUF2500 domain-containing protein [Robertmurraya andreesenii]MDQ0157523.1 cytoskeletal protein RodZ [Robertmurraya andreesenii]
MFHDPFGDFMFSFGPIFIGIIFIIVIGTFLFALTNGLKEWRRNEQSPQLSVPAIVKTKRTNVSRHTHHHDSHHSHSTSTTYYATFEFESGDRLELKLTGAEYGQLAEGDYGILTFQGTRYLGFKRSV